MARSLIAKPKTLSEVAALVGKRVVVTSFGIGDTVRLQPHSEHPERAYWRSSIEGEVTGYHRTNSELLITLAGYGSVYLSIPTTHVYRVLPSWWHRALIWLGLSERPAWF